MNKRALYLGIVYSILVIIYKILIISGGYQLTRFGYFYSHAVSGLAVLPFMILAVKLTRDKDMGGYISGRDAMKAALGVFGISVIILSVYTYIEFDWKMRDISLSKEYLEFITKEYKVKPESYPAILKENEVASAMKAVTAKLFSFFLISFSFAFIVAVIMKRRPA